MREELTNVTLRQMRASYGGFVDKVAMVSLDPIDVPVGLVSYLPYAALWGVADDLERERRIQNAPAVAKLDLVKTVRLIDDQLDEWLAGDEATSEDPSEEYVAFSAKRMAADFIRQAGAMIALAWE